MRVEVQEPGGGGAVDVLEGPTPVVLCSVLGRAGVGGAAFVSPDEELFSSSKGGYTHKAQKVAKSEVERGREGLARCQREGESRCASAGVGRLF
eukprot:366262-Chlamydomonas_euryale.AAC.1